MGRDGKAPTLGEISRLIGHQQFVTDLVRGCHCVSLTTFSSRPRSFMKIWRMRDLDGSERQVELGCDFRLGFVFVVSHGEQFPFIVAQFGHGPCQLCGVLVAREFVVWLGRCTQLQHGIVGIDLRVTLAPKGINPKIAGDSEDPGRGASLLRIEQPRLAPNRRHCLLGQFLGAGRIAPTAHEKALHARRIKGEYGAKGFPVRLDRYIGKARRHFFVERLGVCHL